MTKAELKRKLAVGTKLTLVNSLMGPTHQYRTVKQVRTVDYIMEKPDGSESHLAITADEYVVDTTNGFRVMLKAQTATPGMPAQPEQIMVEYVFGHVEQSMPTPLPTSHPIADPVTDTNKTYAGVRNGSGFQRGNYTDSPCWYASVMDANRHALVFGPFASEAVCRQWAYNDTESGGTSKHNRLVNEALNRDAKAWFYSWGMVKTENGYQDGVLNRFMGETDLNELAWTEVPLSA